MMTKWLQDAFQGNDAGQIEAACVGQSGSLHAPLEAHPAGCDEPGHAIRVLGGEAEGMEFRDPIFDEVGDAAVVSVLADEDAKVGAEAGGGGERGEEGLEGACGLWETADADELVELGEGFGGAGGIVEIDG